MKAVFYSYTALRTSTRPTAAPRCILKALYGTSSRPHPNRKNYVRTLDASKLRPSDHMDLTGSVRPILRFESLDDVPGYASHWSQVRYSYHQGAIVPFPPDTRGFLYYHPAPSDKPDVTSEIRFRVTTADDAKAFAAGSDLLLPNGAPWRIPLLRLVGEGRDSRTPSLSHLMAARLLEDGLVTKALLRKCRRLVKMTEVPAGLSRKIVIHSLGQPFPVDFAHNRVLVTFLGAESTDITRTLAPWASVTKKGRPPYSGTALCCFEAYPAETSESEDTLAMRVVKLTSPVVAVAPDVPDVVPLPREGELLKRLPEPVFLDNSTDMSKAQPWTLPPRVDKAEMEAIRDVIRRSSGQLV
ncbi:hypothetical protein HWV62_34195 [Athelia sp. TMB]|nr:hypothetical protein HWV62_34195 [Athelia sp. TMB]